MTSPTLRLARVLLPTLAVLAGCSGGSSSPDKPVDPVKPAPKYQAEIRRTAFGIPHIKGSSEGDIGYGVGYAYAEDNLCTLAEEVITASGQRSRFFGPDGTRVGYQSTNLAADYFYRILNDDEAVNQSWAAQPAEIKALVQGYVAGYNQYLKETGAQSAGRMQGRAVAARAQRARCDPHDAALRGRGQLRPVHGRVVRRRSAGCAGGAD